MVREIKEEMGIDTVAHERLAVFENIFTFNGELFHEIVFIYRVSFVEKRHYDRDQIFISDSSREPTTAVWRERDQIRAEGAKLYPEGMEALLREV